MKDFKELIKIADVYGTETKGLAEQREVEIQKNLDEGIWDDLVGGISDLAKKLGIAPEAADKVANAISTQPEAKAEVEKADPGNDPTGNTSGKAAPAAAPDGSASSGIDGPADAAAKAAPAVAPLQDPTGGVGGADAAAKAAAPADAGTTGPDGNPTTMPNKPAPVIPPIPSKANQTPMPGEDDPAAAPLQDPTGGVGGADAAAKAAPAVAPAKPAGLDIKTPNIMKAYNAGGKKAMPSIKTMQLALSKAGYDPNGNDGKYGPGTFAAVKSFQQANGLTADGQAGPSTMKKLQLVSQTVTEASMNISMNGTDAGEVAELVDILKNAGVNEPEAMAIKSMPTMSLSGPNSPLSKGPIDKGPFDGGPMDDNPRSMMDKPSSGPFDGGPMDDKPGSAKPCDVCGGMHEEYDAIVAEWDNSPDPEYKDSDYMINDLAGGINRPKKSFAPVNGGDNPMKLSVKETLQKALKETKQSKKWK